MEEEEEEEKEEEEEEEEEEGSDGVLSILRKEQHRQYCRKERWVKCQKERTIVMTIPSKYKSDF